MVVVVVVVVVVVEEEEEGSLFEFLVLLGIMTSSRRASVWAVFVDMSERNLEAAEEDQYQETR